MSMPNGHTASNSPNINNPHVRFNIMPHVRGVETINPTSEKINPSKAKYKTKGLLQPLAINFAFVLQTVMQLIILFKF